MKLYRFDDKMQLHRVRVYPYILVGICLVGLLSISSSPKRAEYEVPPVFLETYTGEEPFNFKVFKQFIVDCGIKYPDIVLAQAIQECNFNSKIWHENHNPFGMKVAKSRNTTAIGVNRGHAQYKNWRMAVLDYALMQAVYAKKVKSRKGYYKYLEHYAEDPGYIQKIKKHVRDHRGFGLSNDYLDDL